MQSEAAETPRSFLTWPDVKRILYLAVPAQLALLTQTAINIVDTWFIGLLDEPDRSDGQAMLSFSLALLWAVGGFLSAISVGTQALVARCEGRGDHQAGGAVLLNALIVAGLSAAVLSVICFPLVGAIFDAASNDPDYIRIGTGYTHWRFVGIVSMVMTAAFKAFYDGRGMTYMHLLAAVVMNVVNVVLCWLLIFGNLGAPRMGVEGAGAAAAVSSWVGLFMMVAFSMRRGDRERYTPYRRDAISRAQMWQLIKLSVPSGVATTGIFDAAHIKAGGSESIYGAATTIIINVLSLTFFSCMAFGVATATLVSQSLGANKPDDAERYAWSSVKIGAMLFSVFGALEIAFPHKWIGIFNHSPAVIEAGSPSMQLMGACGPLIAAGMILTQALFGAGNPRFVMFVEVLLHFFVLLPVAYGMGVVLDFGLIGVWSSAAVYVLLLTLIMALKFRQGDWKHIKL